MDYIERTWKITIGMSLVLSYVLLLKIWTERERERERCVTWGQERAVRVEKERDIA